MADDKTLHFSAGKLGIEQIPAEVLAYYALVFTYGEGKYARDNWKKGTKWHEFLGSAERHILAWRLGEMYDPESGIPHLAHAIWNLGALIYYEEYEIGEDDVRVIPSSSNLGSGGETLEPEAFLAYIRGLQAEIAGRVAAYHASKAGK